VREGDSASAMYQTDRQRKRELERVSEGEIYHILLNKHHIQSIGTRYVR
jgi:hypothetical protein